METEKNNQQTKGKDMSFKPKYLLLLAPLLVTACSSVPTGPSVNVMPGPNASFEQFKADDEVCREYAVERVGDDPSSYDTASTVKSAAVTTAIGAAAGAAFDHGHARGAAVGAGAGLLLGTLAGSGKGSEAYRAAQVQYDNAYTQCMYAKGHSVPMAGNYGQHRGQRDSYTPPPPRTTNPPPDDYVVPDIRSEKAPSNDDYVVQEN